MKALYRAGAAALAIAVLWAVAWGSAAPVRVHHSEHGILRLAWSVRPERVEECREQTPEELAKLPQHMRQRVVCEGSSARYRLTVMNGDALMADRIVRGGGLRHDRRIYVFQEVVLDPGEAAIKVRFDRVDAEGTRSTTSKGGNQTQTVPPHLALDEHLRVRPRQVILVTYSPERQALVAVRDAAATGSSR